MIKQICDEEVSHVKHGVFWFKYFCEKESLDPRLAYHELVLKYIENPLPGNFNEAARTAADFPKEWYFPMGDKVRKRQSKQNAVKPQIDQARSTLS